MTITEAELDAIRAEQEKFMPERVSIVKTAYIAPGEQASDTVASDVPAAFTPGFGFWRSVADRYQSITAYNLTLPWDQSIEAGHRVIDSEGRTFEVRDVRSPSSYKTATLCLVDHIS